MSHRSHSLLLSLLLATTTLAGCTLIAEVDRSKIPDEEGDGGEGSVGDSDTDGTAGGTGEGGLGNGGSEN